MDRLRPAPRHDSGSAHHGGARAGGSASRRARSEAGVVQQLLLFLVLSVVGGVLLAGMALPFVGTAGVAARTTVDGFEELPSELETPPLAQRSRILAADGSNLTTFFFQNRVDVPLDAMAPDMRAAIVAIEDSRFYEHGGVDLRGTARAFVNNQTGETVQGGSTITQQYVKNVLLEQAVAEGDEEAVSAATARAGLEGYARKLQEVRYAIALEDRFSKGEILERYLNIAYFGSGAYGVEAAARHYFSVPAAELTLPQAATLAGLVQQPGAFDPTRNPEAALDRRSVVLDRMAELGYISQDEADAASEAELGLEVSETNNGCQDSSAPFFCDYVLATIRIDPAFGETAEERIRLLKRGGLTITTTLDPEIQQAAQEAVDARVPRDDPNQFGAAIAMVEPGTGKILAMAQNRTYGTADEPGVTTVNYVADAEYGGSAGFLAGSTFKVYTLAAAIQQGIPLNTEIESPEEKTFEGFENCQTGAEFPPYEDVGNSTRSGTFTIEEGAWFSVNTLFVELEQRTGLCDPFNIAAATGVHPADSSVEAVQYQTPSFTLGTMPVSPLRMAESYATFAAGGLHCDSIAITEVLDGTGESLALPERGCEQVLDAKVAQGVNAVLSGVIDGPAEGRTGRRQSLGRPAAGKTGTTTENFDLWFAGYTPDLAAAAWVGDPDASMIDGELARQPIQDVTIGGEYFESGSGGRLPGVIWQEAMSAALADVPPSNFLAPPQSVYVGDEIEVPDVTGDAFSTAAQTLLGAGFSTFQTSGFSITVPEGSVIRTIPAAGTELRPGAQVTIVVSGGALFGTAPQPTPTPAPSPTAAPTPTPTPTPTATPTPTPTPTATPTPTPTPTPSSTPTTSPSPSPSPSTPPRGSDPPPSNAAPGEAPPEDESTD